MKLFNKEISIHDLAHGWIPILILFISAIAAKFIQKLGIDIQHLFIIALLLLIVLQTVNELIQYFDKDRDAKYGSRKGFLLNSRKDWLLFLAGIFLGSIIFTLIVGL